MTFFAWTDELALGVTDMDREHQHLLMLMNQLYDQNEAGAGPNALIATFAELQDYTVKHFADEEAYMDKIGYPDADKHKRIHQDLLAKLTDHYDAMMADPGAGISSNVFNFLKMWLAAHIKGIDRGYADFNPKKSAA